MPRARTSGETSRRSPQTPMALKEALQRRAVLCPRGVVRRRRRLATECPHMRSWRSSCGEDQAWCHRNVDSFGRKCGAAGESTATAVLKRSTGAVFSIYRSLARSFARDVPPRPSAAGAGTAGISDRRDRRAAPAESQGRHRGR